MRTVLSKIEGDKVLWGLVSIMALCSMFPVFSASSNLAFSNNGSTVLMLLKHAFHISLGLLIMFFIHRIDYRLIGSLSRFMLPLLLILLLYTLFFGVSVSNATRWIRIPGTSQTFQTSALAWVVLPLYLARYLSKAPGWELQSFKHSFVGAILPIVVVCALILPSNFSTAAMLFAGSLLVLFVGGYPLKNLVILMATGAAGLALFVLLIFQFPNLNNRVATWKVRIEAFTSGNAADNFQVNKAKTAIAEGYLTGKGPGKSIQKNFLPQSNSDFIYAIIVEEFGIFGAVATVAFYLVLLVRVLIISTKAATTFGTLASFAVSVGIIMQALVNLAVAVNLFPVTGQTLPLISAGGSSIWVTCAAIGIILSISVGKQSNLDQPLEGESEIEPEKIASHV
jgi:cell division protein FtsW